MVLLRVFCDEKSGGAFECNDATSTQNAFMCSKSAIGLVIGGRFSFWQFGCIQTCRALVEIKARTQPRVPTSMGRMNAREMYCINYFRSPTQSLCEIVCLLWILWERRPRNGIEREEDGDKESSGWVGNLFRKKSISHPNWKKPRICQCLRR